MGAGVGVCLFFAVLFAIPLGIAAAQDIAARITVTVNGQEASTSSDAHPAQLNPNRLVKIEVKVANTSSTTIRISTARFEGAVLDLPLFSYDSTVNLDVPGHATRSLMFPVSMTGIGSQATGLVVATVTLISPSGAVLASQSIVTNVQGSIASLYGLFGLAVLVLTISSLFFALLAMARHRLSTNRWVRGVRFLIPGLGVGLVLIFTMSVLGVFAPGPGHWLPILIISSAAGLAAGYLTPAPEEEEYDDYDPDVLMAEIIVVDDDPLGDVEPLAPASGVVQPTAITPSGSPDARSTSLPDDHTTIAPDGRSTIGS